MGYAPPQEGDGVGQIRKTIHLMVLRGLFPSLPPKKTAKPNLVISVVFLVALGLWVTVGWCATSGGLRGRTIQKDIVFDGLKGAVNLITLAKDAQAKWSSLWYFWSIWGSDGALGVT